MAAGDSFSTLGPKKRAPHAKNKSLFNTNTILIFKEVRFMFWTIVVILLILWLLGFSLGLVGGLIHILLVVAIIVILIRIIQGRKPL